MISYLPAGQAFILNHYTGEQVETGTFIYCEIEMPKCHKSKIISGILSNKVWNYKKCEYRRERISVFLSLSGKILKIARNTFHCYR